MLLECVQSMTQEEKAEAYARVASIRRQGGSAVRRQRNDSKGRKRRDQSCRSKRTSQTTEVTQEATGQERLNAREASRGVRCRHPRTSGNETCPVMPIRVPTYGSDPFWMVVTAPVRDYSAETVPLESNCRTFHRRLGA